MSEWREIWAKGIGANQRLVQNRIQGEVEFKKLLSQYPDDGMIYYSRGEAYENLLIFDNAIFDYETAAKCFPAPQWKDVAKFALERVSRIKASDHIVIPGISRWDIFHRVYAVHSISHKIRVDSLSAIERFDSEPHLSAIILRTCLEDLVTNLLKDAFINYSDAPKIEDRIDLIERLGIVPHVIASKMGTVRDLGNKGTHSDKSYGKVNFSPILLAFVEILEAVAK